MHVFRKFQTARSKKDLVPFLGCDSVSAFYGKGKVAPLKAIRKDDDFVAAFCKLGDSLNVALDVRKALEKFVCCLYSCAGQESVNEARFNLFKKGQYSEKFLPPTNDVLQLHISRANYQSFIWKTCLTCSLDLPSFEHHGWTIVDNVVAVEWMLLPIAPDGVLSFISCSCKKGCTSNRCSCFKASLACSDLCRCAECKNALNQEESEHEDEYINIQDSSDSEFNTGNESSVEDSILSEWETSEWETESTE